MVRQSRFANNAPGIIHPMGAIAFADNLRQLLPLLLREWPVDEDSEVHRDGAGTEMALARLFCSNSAPHPRPSSAPVLLQVRAITTASERDEVSLLGFDFQSRANGSLADLRLWAPGAGFWILSRYLSSQSTLFRYLFDTISIPFFL